MKLLIASGAACLALSACATAEVAPPPPPLRPVVTYTLEQSPAVVVACLHRIISRVAAIEERDGLRVTVANIPGAYLMVYSSVDGTRAEIYETIATQAGVFRVGLDQCEATLPRRRLTRAQPY